MTTFPKPLFAKVAVQSFKRVLELVFVFVQLEVVRFDMVPTNGNRRTSSARRVITEHNLVRMNSYLVKSNFLGRYFVGGYGGSIGGVIVAIIISNPATDQAGVSRDYCFRNQMRTTFRGKTPPPMQSFCLFSHNFTSFIIEENGVHNSVLHK